MEAVAGDETHQ